MGGQQSLPQRRSEEIRDWLEFRNNISMRFISMGDAPPAYEDGGIHEEEVLASPPSYQESTMTSNLLSRNQQPKMPIKSSYDNMKIISGISNPNDPITVELDGYVSVFFENIGKPFTESCCACFQLPRKPGEPLPEPTYKQISCWEWAQQMLSNVLKDGVRIRRLTVEMENVSNVFNNLNRSMTIEDLCIHKEQNSVSWLKIIKSVRYVEIHGCEKSADDILSHPVIRGAEQVSLYSLPPSFLAQMPELKNRNMLFDTKCNPNEVAKVLQEWKKDRYPVGTQIAIRSLSKWDNSQLAVLIELSGARKSIIDTVNCLTFPLENQTELNVGFFSNYVIIAVMAEGSAKNFDWEYPILEDTPKKNRPKCHWYTFYMRPLIKVSEIVLNSREEDEYFSLLCPACVGKIVKELREFSFSEEENYKRIVIDWKTNKIVFDFDNHVVTLKPIHLSDGSFWGAACYNYEMSSPPENKETPSMVFIEHTVSEAAKLVLLNFFGTFAVSVKNLIVKGTEPEGLMDPRIQPIKVECLQIKTEQNSVAWLRCIKSVNLVNIATESYIFEILKHPAITRNNVLIHFSLQKSYIQYLPELENERILLDYYIEPEELVWLCLELRNQKKAKVTLGFYTNSYYNEAHYKALSKLPHIQMTRVLDHLAFTIPIVVAKKEINVSFALDTLFIQTMTENSAESSFWVPSDIVKKRFENSNSSSGPSWISAAFK